MSSYTRILKIINHLRFACLPIAICLLVIAIMTSCDYDVNEEFFIKTQSSYFLVQSAISNQKSILLIQDSTVTANWERRTGLSAGQLGDMAGLDDRLWLSDIQLNRLLRVNPETQAVEEIIALGELIPHHISIGTTHILIADTVHQRIGFRNLKNSELIIRDQPTCPTQSTYRSQKFYVLFPPNQVGIFSERAFTQIDRLSLQHPVQDVQVDNQKFVVIHSGDSLLFESLIDVNTDAFTQLERPTNFRKVRLSPFPSADFETELLEPVALRADKRLTVRSLEQVEDFEVDFFESELYIVRNDSLFRYKLATSSPVFLGNFRGNFVRSYFYKDFIGE